jgi:phage baseplate assembly protein W
MGAEQNEYIGTGWSFPPTFNPGGKDLEMTSGIIDIENSLHILLSTALQERVMQPTYGCNLDFMLFQSMDEHFKTYLSHLVKSAITYHEARIKADDIQVQTDEAVEGRALIIINYTVRSTNTKLNYVYPFYINF